MRTATAMQICVHAMKAHSYWATNFTYRDVLAYSKKPDLNDHDLKNFPDNCTSLSLCLSATSFPRIVRLCQILS